MENPKSTDKEISELLGEPINTICPRRGELLDMDILEDAGTRKCSITNRTAHTWQVKTLDKTKVNKLKTKRIICPLCLGKGHIIRPQVTLEGFQ